MIGIVICEIATIIHCIMNNLFQIANGICCIACVSKTLITILLRDFICLTR